MVLRPRTRKFCVPNTGPYLVISLHAHTVTLQNLATGATLQEHSSNVRPLNLP